MPFGGGRELRVVLTSEVSKFRKNMSDAASSTEGFSRRALKSFKAIGIGVGILAGALTVLAVKMGVDAVKAAIADQSTQAALARQMKATTKATDAQVAAMEDYITAAQKRTGLDDGDMRKGLERLIRSTKDQTRAQQIMNTALKISLATGKPLVQVTEALAKFNDGSANALKRLGITIGPAIQSYADMQKQLVKVNKAQEDAKRTLEQYGPASEQYKKAVTKVEDATEKLRVFRKGSKWVKELNKEFSGAEAADADTYAGKLRRLSTAWDEFQESFGYGLLDGADAGKNGVDDLTQALYDNQKSAELAGKAFADLAATILGNLGAFEVGAMRVSNFFSDVADSYGAASDQLDDWLGRISDGEAQARNDARAQSKKARDDALRQAAWEMTGHTGPAPGTGQTSSAGSGSGRGGGAGAGGGGGGGFNGNHGGSWGDGRAPTPPPRSPASVEGAHVDPSRTRTRDRDAAWRADARTAQLGARTRPRS